MISTRSQKENDALVANLAILTTSECADVRQVVHKLKSLWDEERYRLGAGISYYRPAALYYATSKLMNPILKEHLSWMYEKLTSALANFYNVDVCFRDDLALPGFNIYCGPTDFSKLNYNIHIDLQFMELNWQPKGSTDFGTTMSFTLPIATPTGGAGLNIWHATQSDIEEQDLASSELLDASKAEFKRYEIGIATIHDGRHYHQMMVAENWLPADERITLQGHGLIQNGKLVIYG